jgi:hypothetical protein
MMRNLIQITLVILVAGFFSCEEPNEIAKEPFVGTWLITEVVLDGTRQRGWTGLEIQIEQDSNNSGSYRVIGTPDESIWKGEGVWIKHETPSVFVRDHDMDVTYSVIDGELMTSFFISHQQEPCIEGPCILSLEGHWLFKAKSNSH